MNTSCGTVYIARKTTIQVLKIPLAFTLCALLASCGSVFYARTPTGKFEGKLYVEWIAPNQFVYRPDVISPLSYTTSAGRKIVPQLMYTDGGSIPRLFWSAPGLGPWDFAPGYIIHDWLFQQHHCKIEDWESYDFPISARILAEALKTQMEKAKQSEPSIVYAVYEAVNSPVAEGLWKKDGCLLPAAAPPVPLPGQPVPPQPVLIMTIEAH